MKKSQLLWMLLVCLCASVYSPAQKQPADGGQGTNQSPANQNSSPQGPGAGRRQRGGDGPGGMMEMLRNATSGTVQSVTSDGMTVKKMDGTTVTVKTTKETMFRRERQEAKLSDFKAGDQVIVGGDPAGENAVTARFIAVRPSGPNAMNPEDLGKKFIVGEVTKIDETKLTVKRPDGVAQVIEVDDDTSFKNAKRESITLTDVKVGDRVMGRGALKNGTFVPATLMVGNPEDGQGFVRRREGAAGGSAAPQTAPPQQNSTPNTQPK